MLSFEGCCFSFECEIRLLVNLLYLSLRLTCLCKPCCTYFSFFKWWLLQFADTCSVSSVFLTTNDSCRIGSNCVLPLLGRYCSLHNCSSSGSAGSQKCVFLPQQPWALQWRQHWCVVDCAWWRHADVASFSSQTAQSKQLQRERPPPISAFFSLKKCGPVVEPLLINESGYVAKFLFCRTKYYWFK